MKDTQRISLQEESFRDFLLFTGEDLREKTRHILGPRVRILQGSLRIGLTPVVASPITGARVQTLTN